MKEKNNNIIRLVFSMVVCVLFIAVTFSSSAGQSASLVGTQTTIENDSTLLKEPGKTTSPFLSFFIHDWNWWDNKPNMFAIPEGNIGIGGVPLSDAKLYVKTNNITADYAIYTEGGKGIKSVSTIFEGTGITGDGGHAGVCGNGYIGLLGFGFYGGWFEGNGYFSGNVGIGTLEMENKLHINGAIQLNPIPQPETPSSGFVIYCDISDGSLKAKATTGVVTVLADP